MKKPTKMKTEMNNGTMNNTPKTMQENIKMRKVLSKPGIFGRKAKEGRLVV